LQGQTRHSLHWLLRLAGTFSKGSPPQSLHRLLRLQWSFFGFLSFTMIKFFSILYITMIYLCCFKNW
jgi:hypothetical protein